MNKSEPSPAIKNVTPTPAGPPKFKRLKKFAQLGKYFIISCVILTLMEIGYAYWLLSSRWHLFLSREEMIAYAKMIDETPAPPANFMKVYTAIFPQHVNTSMSTQVFVNYGSRMLFRHTELDDKPHCFCDMTYDIIRKQDDKLYDLEWDGRLQDLEFGFGMEKYTTPAKCLNFAMGFRITEMLSKIDRRRYPNLVNKPLEQFSDDEMLAFILFLKTRNRFSPYRKSAKYEKEFARYKAKLIAAQEIEAEKAKQ